MHRKATLAKGASNIGAFFVTSTAENQVSHDLWVLQVPFGKLQVVCHVPFTEEWLYTKAWLVECCKDGCSSGMFSNLHRGTLELYQSDLWVLGHLPDQGPFPTIAQFARMASSRKSLGSSKLLLFKNDGGECVLVDLQGYKPFLVLFPRSVPQHNHVSELYGQFLQPHGLVFALKCTVNCGNLHRQMCAFLNHVQSIEFTTGGLQSSCRNSSRIIYENRMYQSSISILIAKLDVYIH
jgi:hypothetical protein